MALQNSQVTESTIRLKELEIQEKMISKWNGQLPATMLNDDINGVFNINK